jgi:hypothetical protein
MERPGQVFGIQDLSWTGDGRALAYRGQWCAPPDLGYGLEVGFECSTRGQNHQPLRAAGTDVIREISVTTGGGTLASGPVLRAPAKVSDPEPVLIAPGGKDLITIVDSPAPDTQNVVRCPSPRAASRASWDRCRRTWSGTGVTFSPWTRPAATRWSG